LLIVGTYPNKFFLLDSSSNLDPNVVTIFLIFRDEMLASFSAKLTTRVKTLANILLEVDLIWKKNGRNIVHFPRLEKVTLEIEDESHLKCPDGEAPEPGSSHRALLPLEEKKKIGFYRRYWFGNWLSVYIKE
jgi:hypothetical protein